MLLDALTTSPLTNTCPINSPIRHYLQLILLSLIENTTDLVFLLSWGFFYYNEPLMEIIMPLTLSTLFGFFTEENTLNTSVILSSIKPAIG